MDAGFGRCGGDARPAHSQTTSSRYFCPGHLEVYVSERPQCHLRLILGGSPANAPAIKNVQEMVRNDFGEHVFLQLYAGHASDA